jgi:hypothetical protein
MSSRLILERCGPPVAEALKNPLAMRKISKYVGEYIDSNHVAFSAQHFGHRVVFDHGKHGEGRHAKLLFDLIEDVGGPSPLELHQLIHTVRSQHNVKFGMALDKPFFWIAAVYLIERGRDAKITDSRDARDLQNLIYYMCFGWWWTLQVKIYKYIPPVEVLNYTVSRLSRKFKIKEKGTALDAIFDSAWNHYLNFKKDLERGSDEDIKSFINAQWSRLNSIFVNFMKETIKDQKAGNYLNTDRDQQGVSGDDGQPEKDMDTFNSAILSIAKQTAIHIASNPPSSRIIALSSRIAKVSEDGLRDSVASMVKRYKIEYFQKLVTNMMSLYVNEGGYMPSTIFSRQFVVYMLQLYARSNTTNTFVIDIKKQLDEILRSVSQQYVATNRKTTQTMLRKSIYVYFALSIQEANRGRSF